jgi:hypothetical protein
MAFGQRPPRPGPEETHARMPTDGKEEVEGARLVVEKYALQVQ